MRIQKDSHITGATIVRILALVCTVIATVSGFPTNTQAVNSTTGKEFWYFANNLSLSGHVDHVSITQLEFADVNYTLATLQALPPDVKAVVGAPILDLCSLRPDWSQRWAEMSAAVAPYMSKVAAFGLSDEPDLRAGFCFPNDPNGPERMVQLMEQASAIVKSTWPNAKTWVNYGTEFRLPNVRLAQNVDWSSFDCYGPFDNCFGSGFSIPQLVDIMATELPNPQTQSIFLISDASCFFYDATGRKTHESELYLRGFQYWQLAVTHPRVKGLIGFLWQGHGPCTSLPPDDTIHDINDSPGLADLYRYLGLNILTGAIPSISTLSVAPECVIPVGASTCTVNFGWTTISGPNVGVFGRLVGDQDAVFGPLCPGATSCALPAGVGDYILELRENWWDVNSKLIHALPVEVRHGSGAPTPDHFHTFGLQEDRRALPAGAHRQRAKCAVCVILPAWGNRVSLSMEQSQPVRHGWGAASGSRAARVHGPTACECGGPELCVGSANLFGDRDPVVRTPCRSSTTKTFGGSGTHGILRFTSHHGSVA